MMLSRGVIYLSLGALCYSLGSLSFAKSGAQSSQISTWVGIIGSPTCILLLALDNSFKPTENLKNVDLYLSLLNGFVFGGAAIFLHFWSLEYILPADNNMVVVFFHICSSVIFQMLEDKRFPSVLTFFSVLFGFIGTFFVCNPKDLLTKNILEVDNLKGVALVALAGVSFACMYANIRRFQNIPPPWTSLGAALGNFASGLTSYNPWRVTSQQQCANMPRLLALLAAVFQTTTLCSNLKGAYEKSVTVTATAVIQLLSPVFSFVLQLFLFPDIVWWRSGLGIFFIILAVGTQLIVLKQRETEIRKELQAHIQNDGFELKEA